MLWPSAGRTAESSLNSEQTNKEQKKKEKNGKSKQIKHLSERTKA